MARSLPPGHNPDRTCVPLPPTPGRRRAGGTIPRIGTDPAPPPARRVPPLPSLPWATASLAALLVLVALGPLVKAVTVQPGSRYALTAAIVERHTIVIDDYAWMTKPSDRIDAPDGHLYSDKAPGQPILAVPAFALASLLGAEPATTPRVEGNLGMWWVTLWSCGVPAALLALLMVRLVAETRPRAAVPIGLLLVFGTPLMVFATELYGHVLATLFGFAAYVLVRRPDRSRGRLIAAGACTALAVSVEFPLALVAVAIVVFLVTTGERGRLLWFGLPAAPVAAAVGWYHSSAFGSPFRTPYALHAVNYGRPDTETGLPRPDVALQLLAGGRGFVLTPIVLAGLAAAAYLLVRRPQGLTPAGRRDAVMALAVFGGLWLFQATRTTDWPGPLGGEMPAPRHLLPAIPFLAAPLAAVWPSWERVVRFLGVVGIVTMAAPTLLLHLILPDVPYSDWYRSVFLEDGAEPTLFTLALGTPGWAVHAALVAGIGVLLLRRTTRRTTRPTPTPNPT